MIKFHPDQGKLSLFSKGALAPAESLLVAAHCDMCQRCAIIVKEATHDVASETFDFAVPEVGMSEQYGAMLAQITQLPPATSAQASRVDNVIELDGKQFTIPRSLLAIADKTGNWNGLIGKLWHAPVDLGYAGAAHFIYMAKGGSVPEHTHRGIEYTLVLDGDFHDGLNQYQAGDYIMMDGDSTHAPQSTASNGCLVFSIMDQPLHFTSGIARLLNPFSHLFFR